MAVMRRVNSWFNEPETLREVNNVVDTWNQHNNGTQVWDRMIAKGTSTNDSAAAGQIGEYIESTVLGGSPVSSTGSTQYFTVTSISLTAGDWDVSLLAQGIKAGTTTVAFYVGIGTADGNSSTGMVQGVNSSIGFLPTADYSGAASIPAFRVSIASTTTYYFKAYFEYTGSAPQAYGRISARRVR